MPPKKADVLEVFAAFQQRVAAKISREDVATRRDLAQAYAEMGLMDEAIAELILVLEVSPDDAAARTLLERLRTLH